MCQGAAYVGVDNVRIATNGSSGISQPAITTTVFKTVAQNLSQSVVCPSMSPTLVTLTESTTVFKTVAQNLSQSVGCPSVSPNFVTLTESILGAGLNRTVTRTGEPSLILSLHYAREEILMMGMHLQQLYVHMCERS